ncbi:leucine-rich repeat domain-containing protein [Rubripirellula tenax]|uniref:leucine-rich repeat domain-containing protein n=1 Tax=Rubripirellula tenax TaxID=2528015 RepID=UPI001FEB0BDF|nr:leucine-rich repeat domain-containing protein [Rubripirellula tenax]
MTLVLVHSSLADDPPKKKGKKAAKDKPAVVKPAEGTPEAKSEAKPESPPEVSIFADKNLEEAVRAEVFAKRNSQAPIAASDVANISRVIGKGKQIKNLSGLEHCKSLMMLDLEDNQISDLTPIAGLLRLQSVTLAGNKIKALKPLEKLVSMQLLDLSGNQVDDLTALEAMSNLRTLYVADNQVSKLDPLSSLTKVWSLDVSNNRINDLSPLAKFGWLTSLDISGNEVESLQPLSTLNELDMLMMSRNRVKDLGPLVDMCKKDFERDRRFSPYLEVYLGENPIDEKAKAKHVTELESFGVDVFDR